MNLETSSASPVEPRIADYNNYRTYLSDWFAWKKGRNPAYSGATFARQAGLGAHTLLGMAIRGQRNLGPDTIRAFSRALSLKGREAVIFEKLVLFNQSRKPDDKAFYLDQLHSVSQGAGRVLIGRIRNHAEYLSHWYVVALRELVSTRDFRPDADWIVKRFKSRITPKQAQEAWQVLVALGMVESDESGRCKVVTPSIDLDPGHVDFAVRAYHRDQLARARIAIDEESLDERMLSSLTMAVRESDLPVLREKINEFRKSLNVSNDGRAAEERDHVVAVNMQMMVLTDGVGAGVKQAARMAATNDEGEGK